MSSILLNHDKPDLQGQMQIHSAKPMPVIISLDVFPGPFMQLEG